VVSPTARCIETVLAFARDHELDIVARRELAIGRVSAAAELVRQLQTTRGHAVVCTHGEVIPPLLTSLGYVAEGASVACAKGSVWTIDDRAGGASYVEQPTATQDDDSLRRVAR
jgi:broad specificity phosphatase PhoE